MAKYLGMIIALLAYQSATAAETTSTTNVKVNCNDIKLSINTVMDDRFNFSAYWNEPAVFPKKPEYGHRRIKCPLDIVSILIFMMIEIKNPLKQWGFCWEN